MYWKQTVHYSYTVQNEITPVCMHGCYIIPAQPIKLAKDPGAGKRLEKMLAPARNGIFVPQTFKNQNVLL